MRKDFVCEECGKELREARPPKRKPKWPIFVGIGAVAVVIIVLCVVLIPGGDRSEVVEPTPVENTDSIAAEAEKARLDSIRAAEAEQARLDSIENAKGGNDGTKRPEKPEGTKDPKGSLDYGTWSGAWKNGQPNGTGTMTYTKERLIDSRDPKKRVAQPGDYIIGEYSNGRLVQGKWYDASNNVKGSIIIGK